MSLGRDPSLCIDEHYDKNYTLCIDEHYDKVLYK
jgi:hypothetical protein